jgi:uncharacterized peroxidase-related enzyme
MPRLEPLNMQELPSELVEKMRQAEEFMGFTPNDALTMARVPGLLQAMSGVVGAAYGPGTVGIELKRLLAVVVSAAAGCQYCAAHTGHGARAAGIDQARLDQVWEFETSPLFSDAERAALRVASAAAQTPNGVTDGQFDDLKRHFDATQIAEIVAVLCLFAFLNRWNHTIATALESSPLRYAREHMAQHGWQPGVHAAE